jgi:hypothetical protein
MKTWGLPFPFLITHILRKKGIKGSPADGPITKSPYFGRIQWNQSLSHMPRDAPEPEPEPEPEPKPMDIPEMPAELERVAEQEEQPEEVEEYEETITPRASDFVHLQDTLMDMRSQIADLQRDARQDRLEIQEMF